MNFIHRERDLRKRIPRLDDMQRRYMQALRLKAWSGTVNFHGFDPWRTQKQKRRTRAPGAGILRAFYPFTFTVENARTTCPLAGAPNARAGSNVVKIRALSIFRRNESESCPERMR